MKLYLSGTDNKYAVEQTLLTLFPAERPEYPSGAPEGDRCEIKLSRGEKYLVCTAKLVLAGRVYRGLARALMLRTIRLFDELVPAGEPPLYLTTQTESWPACGMYLKLGFVPYAGPMPPGFAADPATFGEKNDEAWRIIYAKLAEGGRTRA